MRPFPQRSVTTAAVLLAVALTGTACGGESSSTPAADRTATATASALTDPQAAQAFFDAVVAGDEEAAGKVATPEAVAFFDPWDPAPDYTFSMGETDGIFFISPGAAPFQCTVADGKVQECADEPVNESPFTDQEAASALFFAVQIGDRQAAEDVATEEALEIFEPWKPQPTYKYTPPKNGIFTIATGAAPFQCTVADGLVQKCAAEPTGN